MPELPDVEVYRKEVAQESINETITDATIGTVKMVKGLSPLSLKKKLKGSTITSTARHGKNLFLELDGKEHLRIHFGMTGSLEMKDENEKIQKHTALALHFKSGRRLDFIDPRKFGAIEYVSRIDEFLKRADIGPDVETLSEKNFVDLIKNKKGNLKAALMDQSLMSGLGNVYTDEVLFQAGYHPEKDISTLSVKELRKIYRKMKFIIKEAVKDHANREEMPKGFLINHRSAGEICPGCRKGKIQMKKVGGRSTYFCNKCQIK